MTDDVHGAKCHVKHSNMYEIFKLDFSHGHVTIFSLTVTESGMLTRSSHALTNMEHMFYVSATSFKLLYYIQPANQPLQ